MNILESFLEFSVGHKQEAENHFRHNITAGLAANFFLKMKKWCHHVSIETSVLNGFYRNLSLWEQFKCYRFKCFSGKSFKKLSECSSDILCKTMEHFCNGIAIFLFSVPDVML